ncbi:sulfurtransferase [candidate division KSB1 bacterium]|nr:MAG: sulfurtransferase [candidate division KSB1 bacterium]
MEKRIKKHPILNVPEYEYIPFYFNGQKLMGRKGEMIISALAANGINILSKNQRDGTTQGLYCANGQCSECAVIANGFPVKSCMTPLKENMIIERNDGYPELPPLDEIPEFKDIEIIKTEVLIIGGGPSGLAAAIELGKLNINTIIVDDKHSLGGKLVLQTHTFFGSVEDCYAGTRGIDIAKMLENEIKKLDSVNVMLNAQAVGVFSDKKVGIFQQGKYTLIEPEKLLITTGAREKALPFAGCSLPGVYGAGAFQTLVNRDLVKSSDRIFVVGGGNVGLIAAYHALQAQITVVGLIEAMPYITGYQVHENKIKRLGVPVYTSHSVLSANGKDKVESITIAKVDEKFNFIKGTEKTFAVDTILIAVGLNPVDEFVEQAKSANIDVYSAGDAYEIAEASSAMFSGKIAGLKIAGAIGKKIKIPEEWAEKEQILKSHPGKIKEPEYPEIKKGVFPVLHCFQEIPCNPCITVCPKNSIKLSDKIGNILDLPEFDGECVGCGRCVAICPGLAITMVDYRKGGETALVTIPYELIPNFREGDKVIAVDYKGENPVEVIVKKIRNLKWQDRTILVTLETPKDLAVKIAGIRCQDPDKMAKPIKTIIPPTADDDIIICRCERVTKGEIKRLIRSGITDMNQIKAITRAGMGPCGGKTCSNLILKMLKDEGINPEKIVKSTIRPLAMEIPVKAFAGIEGE